MSTPVQNEIIKTKEESQARYPICQYPFPHEKLQWQGPSLSHPLPRTLGISYHVIFHPFPLFLLSGRDSSIIFFQVPSPVFPLHPLTSRFVMSSHPRM